MKPTVVLTYPLDPRVVREELAPHANVVLANSRAKLHRALPGAEGLITLLLDTVDDALLARAPRLKVVGNVAVGVNNIDLEACARRGVRVVNTPDVLTRATAELTLALLLAAARRVPEGERLCRSGRWKGWDPAMLHGLDLHGRHAVIVGPGRIGRETGRLFKALGMSVEFIARDESAAGVKRKLAKAQVLSLHVPLTEGTRHWLDARKLALLPSDAIVLNTSRGPVIDEKALIAALRKKQIFAAGLDVYENEPEIPAPLRKLPNVVLLPHLGSATRQTREAMARLAASGVAGILRGKRIRNEVRLPSGR